MGAKRTATALTGKTPLPLAARCVALPLAQSLLPPLLLFLQLPLAQRGLLLS